jgi:hypothetical protein
MSGNRQTPSRNDSRATTHRGATDSFATVLVLLLLVLLSGLAVAFLSSSHNNRALSASTAATTRVESLSRAALSTIEADLLDEITANGTSVGTGTNLYYIPRYPTSVVPQRVVASLTDSAAVVPNIVKLSRTGVPSWYLLTSSTSVATTATSNGPIRVLPTSSGSSSTTISSANGITVSSSRWLLPGLMGTSLPSGFVAPDWVLLTQSGAVDTRSTTPAITDLSNSKGNNFVIGRYTYVVYDVGGLIDINYAGNQLATETNSRRFRANQIPLGSLQATTTASTGTGNACIANPTAITSWRDTTALAASTNYLLSATNTFQTLQSGQQTFVNRQDLINFQKKHSGWMSASALQYLTVYSRSLNRPQFTIPTTLTKAAVTTTYSWDVIYSDTTTHKNPTELLAVRRSDGTLFMKNRFPLSRLKLFEDPTGNAAQIKKYFGLTRSSDGYSWVYTGQTGSVSTLNTTIKTLSDVAAESTAREPDFFEVLQAAILNGSLTQSGMGGWWPSGKTSPDFSSTAKEFWSGESVAETRFRDGDLTRHVLQIGANIIDQYDSDDYPTIIKRTVRAQIADKNGASIQTVTQVANIAGVENIPYLSHSMLRIYRLSDSNNEYSSRAGLGAWWHFQFWNPHQNAADSGTGSATPSKYRVVMTGGVSQMMYGMQLNSTTLDTTNYLATGGYIYTPQIDYYTAYQNSSVNTPYQIQFDLNDSATNKFADPRDLMPGKFNASTPGDDQNYSNEGPSGMLGILVGKELVPGKPLYPSTAPSYFGSAKPNFLHDATDTGVSFEIQFKDSSGTWRTYQRFADLSRYTTSQGSMGTGDSYFSDSSTPADHDEVKYDSWATIGIYTHHVPARLDPRGERFGLGVAMAPMVDIPLQSKIGAMAIGCPDNPKLFFQTNRSSVHSSSMYLYSLAENLYNASSPSYNGGLTGTFMVDRDGVLRHGDPDNISVSTNKVDPLSTIDTARFRKRPVILNRPFQSVGEMGYAFRDLPWKTVDFSSTNSADAALLDFFTCEDPYGSSATATQSTALLRGKIDLNSQQPAVLQTVLNGVKLIDGGTSVSGVVSSQVYVDATTTANGTAVNNLINDLVKSTRVVVSPSGVATVSLSSGTAVPQPLGTRGDLVKCLGALGTASSSYSPSIGMGLMNISPIKAEKEGIVRALSDLGDTQTWNLMIDIIVQSGRYPVQSANAGADKFVVEAERHYWMHVAIDRLSGRVIDSKIELVDE